VLGTPGREHVASPSLPMKELDHTALTAMLIDKRTQLKIGFLNYIRNFTFRLETHTDTKRSTSRQEDLVEDL
jgi:hypothetical protein